MTPNAVSTLDIGVERLAERERTRDEDADGGGDAERQTGSRPQGHPSMAALGVTAMSASCVGSPVERGPEGEGSERTERARSSSRQPAVSAIHGRDAHPYLPSPTDDT